MSEKLEHASTRRDLLKGGAALAMLAAGGLPRLAGAQSAQLVRPNVASLSADTVKMLNLYQQAVAKMKDPAINNPPQPNSWTFQANIHCLPVDATDPGSKGLWNGTQGFKDRIDEIYGNPATGTPVAAWKIAALACWSTCPHGSVFFLPWHRWYIFYFEQVVAAMCGDSSFSLPYWNYASNVGDSLQLPPMFRADPSSSLYEKIRGQGFANPLGIGPQNVQMNDGGYMLFAQITYAPSLLATKFFPADVSAQPTPYSREWFALGYAGRTEIMPHDDVHDAVGGLMGNVPTAAADPVFFLHHCQIDRLWASWQSYSGTTMNFATQATDKNTPTQADWKSQIWSFVDGKGALIKQDAPSAMDYKALGYSYDALVQKPPVVVLPTMLVAQASDVGGAKKLVPEAISVAANVEIKSGGTTATAVPLTGRDASVAKLGAATPSTTLVLSDVKLVKRPPAVLHVFVNMPTGVQSDINGPYHVGAISLFKLSAQGEVPGKGHGSHSAGGREYTFDIGELLAKQWYGGQWTGGPVTVTISAVGANEPIGQTYLTIGKIEIRR